MLGNHYLAFPGGLSNPTTLLKVRKISSECRRRQPVSSYLERQQLPSEFLERVDLSVRLTFLSIKPADRIRSDSCNTLITKPLRDQ